jgi:hypothetical protein
VLNLATVWRAENKADDFLNLMALFRSSLSLISSIIWLLFDCFLSRGVWAHGLGFGKKAALARA